MSRKSGNLRPAHQGYRYQDILSAYILVLALVDRYDSVIIDEKQVDDDRFDDIEITLAESRVRRQVKSSIDPTRRLKTEDFTGNSSSLRIDRLILTARQEPGVSEYRLCATWDIPDTADSLLNMLHPVVATQTVAGSHASCFRLNSDVIWPSDGNPVWTPLSDLGAGITRTELINFCDRFLIELKLPAASTNLLSPGYLEKAVLDLLSDRVGIGRYPNQSRSPSDVAALAVALATFARTHHSKLDPLEIANYLELRLDYGRVAQAFPIDQSRFYNRPTFRQQLGNDIEDGGIHLVVAAPGSGKSWELTKLADELALKSGVIVARHYCYLEPGDEQVERRITSDVFFGNLIAELFDAAPELSEFPRSYAADLNTLESVLENALSLEKSVILIVDGLDHIARVLAATSSLSDDEVDIVEQLATLRLPKGVSLVLGSQPGSHLQILSANGNQVTEHQLPPWAQEDIVGLASILGVPEALSAALLSDDDATEILTLLAERSDGNPLYAWYLSNGLISGLQAGLIVHANDWLQSSPSLQGNIATYYQHLYASISSQAQAIADIFGTIDFSVSEEDLKQILPQVIHDWIPQALIALSPILSRSTTQGGMRIFHESFRRFMLDELARQGRQLLNVLEPVISWLEERNFFADAKSYRFLLPLLRRADRNTDVLNYVGTDFVSQSVSYAHPADAIQRNLALAAEIAARIQDWPFLVRCAELRRMLSTCFDEGNNSWYEFWNTYAHMHGPEALAERLLFDGKPTQNRDPGLRACKIIDDLGAAAPWQVYLDIFEKDKESAYSNEESDYSLASDELVVLAGIQGYLRTGKITRILRRVYRNLTWTASSTSPLFVYELSKLLAQFGFEIFLLKLALRGDDLVPGKLILRADYSTSLRIGVADEFRRRGDTNSAKEVATIALRTARTPEGVISCLERGAPINQTHQFHIDPTVIDLGFGAHYIQEGLPIRQWVSIMRLGLILDPRSDILESERIRVSDEGWYRCWLKYVIAIAEAEAAAHRSIPYEIRTAFATLAEDVRPFVGNPRACDLYSIRLLIKESLERGLALVQTKDDFEFVLIKLMNVSHGTASRLDREDGGPVPIGTLIDVLMPYITHTENGESTRSAIASLIEEVDAVGTYYSTHATYTMNLAKVLYAAGQIAEARECWTKIGKYLTGYGWRKDITLFDIIESAPTIAKASQQKAIQALIDLQPLIAAVLRHTDGRSTNRAPNAWIRSLLEVDPATGVELIARSILQQDGDEGWVTLQGVKDTLKSFLKIADPLLLNAVWDTIAFRIEYDNAAGFEAEERLDPLRALFAIHPEMAKERIYRLAAEITNNETRRNKEAVDMLNALVAELGMSFQCKASHSDDHRYGRDRLSVEDMSKLIDARHPQLLFHKNDNYVALLCGIRKLAVLGNNIELTVNSAIQYLAYRLPEMIEDGDASGAIRIIRFLAHQVDLSYSLKRHPLFDLAISLENAGYANMAAMAHTLAYTSSRGGNGWLNLGDEEHSSAMHRAIELDREIALQTIADEIGRRLRHTAYGAGISRHLIERIAEWDQPEVALSAWKEAFAVIQQRLPLGLSYGWLAQLQADELSIWTPDEGLVALLLVRLGEPRLSRKISSLCGLLKVVRHRPDALSTPLVWWMSRDTPISSLLLILNLLYLAETEPYQITAAISQQLNDYARTDCWGIVMLASTLLRRAGLWVPAPQSLISPVNPPPPSDLVFKKLHTLDDGHILEMLEAWWGDLPLLVGNRYSQLESNASYRERINDRLKLAFGHSGDSKPSTRVLLWQNELFLTALHTEMMGFKAHLWANGMWTEDMEAMVLSATLPDLRIHLALWNSRVPRPDWVLPKNTVAGVSDLKLISADDNRFGGWARLGLAELQFIKEDQHTNQPFEIVSVMSGVIASPLGQTPSATSDLFNSGPTDAWWVTPGEEAQTPLTIIQPLLTANRVTDWIGDELVLMPGGLLHKLCIPRIPEFGEALIWKDSNNEPMLALRTWTIKRSQYDNEPDEFRGQDIIIRPDVLQMIKEQLCCSFSEVTFIRA